MSFRDRLRQALKEADMSQADLARAVHVSTAAVAQWYTGVVTKPSAEHVVAIARACRVDPTWLVTGKESGVAVEDPITEQLRALAPELRAHLEAVISALADAAGLTQVKEREPAPPDTQPKVAAAVDRLGRRFGSLRKNNPARKP